MKHHLSASEFARMISKDTKTVTRWIERGLIPGARRVGTYYQIPLEEVEKAKLLKEYPPQEVWQK
jgi:predicted site-specific integrase-resolvase